MTLVGLPLFLLLFVTIETLGGFDDAEEAVEEFAVGDKASDEQFFLFKPLFVVLRHSERPIPFAVTH